MIFSALFKDIRFVSTCLEFMKYLRGVLVIETSENVM